MTNEEIARFFNNTQAFIRGNSDLRDLEKAKEDLNGLILELDKND